MAKNDKVLVSIIIPVLDDDASLRRCLTSLSNQLVESVETLVADGGDSKEARNICHEFGVRYFKAPEVGRAAQMNFGALEAKGQWLWFLHADTVVPPNAILLLLEACRMPDVVRAWQAVA